MTDWEKQRGGGIAYSTSSCWIMWDILKRKKTNDLRKQIWLFGVPSDTFDIFWGEIFWIFWDNFCGWDNWRNGWGRRMSFGIGWKLWEVGWNIIRYLGYFETFYIFWNVWNILISLTSVRAGSVLWKLWAFVWAKTFSAKSRCVTKQSIIYFVWLSHSHISRNETVSDTDTDTDLGQSRKPSSRDTVQNLEKSTILCNWGIPRGTKLLRGPPYSHITIRCDFGRNSEKYSLKCLSWQNTSQFLLSSL